MPVGLDEKGAASYTFIPSKKAAPKNITFDLEVDYSVFGAKEIRDVLKSREHCLKAGFPPNHIIIATLNEIRDHYVSRVGLPTYLSQMLGELAKVPVQHCALYDAAGQQLQLDFKSSQHQPIQRFIARQFSVGNLPYRIEARRESAPDQVEVRYL